MRRRIVMPVAASLIAVVAALLPSTPALATRPAPEPIPGGIQVPDGPFLHVFLPGPKSQGFMGFNVEPSTITDFQGLSSVGIFEGSAIDTEGNPYDLEFDLRLFRGEYIAGDGSHAVGTFALI